MPVTNIPTPVVAIPFDGRNAVYIEGVYCAFSQVQLVTEDGTVPRLQLTIPATEEMVTLPRRARVHVMHREIIKDEWVCLMEAEVVRRGWQKNDSNRDLYFEAAHVVIHLDSYSIQSLDPAQATMAAMRGTDLTTPTMGAALGNIMELLHPDAVLAELALLGITIKQSEMTFAHWTIAAYQRYTKLIEASRVRNSYSHRATQFHRLFDRVVTPDPALMKWDEFYTTLMSMVFTQSAQGFGGEISFFQLIQTVAQHFLYNVSVVPNAEHYKHQIQVRPQTFFNAIPRCNVVYPSLSENIDFMENLETKPTRMMAQFLPLGTSPSQDLTALARYITVYGPNELQWRWKNINKALTAGGTSQAGVANVDATTKALTVTAPKDGIPFLTREEDQRGIRSESYAIPPTLNAAIMALVQKGPAVEEDSPLPTPEGDDAIGSQAFTMLRADDEGSRITKYWSFLCMALGDGNGIDPKKFAGPYKKLGQGLVVAPTKGRFVGQPLMRPRRITIMGLKIPVRYGEGKNYKPVLNVEPLQAAGVNYYIDRKGTIIQVLPRRYHLFSEPVALPLGVVVQGVSNEEARLINLQMPPKNLSFKASAALAKANFTAFMQAPWPAALTAAGKGQPVGGIINQVFFDSAWVAANVPEGMHFIMEDAKFDKIAPGDEVTIASYSPSGGPTRQETGIKVVEKLKVGTVYWIRLSRAVIKRGDQVAFKIVNTLAPDTGATTAKPWLVMGQAPAAGAPTLPTSTLNRIDDPIREESKVTGGNHFNLVIGLELEDKASQPTKEQIVAAGFLTAVVRELSGDKAGTAKQKLNSESARGVRIPLSAVRQAKDYFSTSGYPYAELGGAVVQIRSEAAIIGNRLYADFNRFDEGLRKGGFSPLADKIEVPSEVADSTLQADINAGSVVQRTSAIANSASAGKDAVTVSRIDLDTQSMAYFIDKYAAALVNFQFYNVRFGPQAFAMKMVFNPYMIVGYPSLILDDSDARYHLLAHVHATTHILTPTDAYTQATMTHVRNARHEKLMPYREAQDQYFFFHLTDAHKYRLDTPSGLTKYQKLLKSQNPPLYAKSFVPWEFLDVESKLPPPFIFHGGFGLNAKNERDFSWYARLLGFVQDNGAPNPNFEDGDFIFAENPIINFAEDADFDLATGASSAAAVKLNIDTRTALTRVYRRIQRVGQNDPSRSQASLVAFDLDGEEPETQPAVFSPAETLAKLSAATAAVNKGLKAALNPGTPFTPGQKVEHEIPSPDTPPERIKVYTIPPTFDAKGVQTDKGKLMPFDTAIQARVLAHTAKCRNREAVIG